jgi:small subunit ribosomal protein S29
MPGERKAARKRIVLSNTNAIEVSNMADMTATLESAQIGTVLGIPGPVVDQLRTVEAFKSNQGWGLFRRPGCLVRAESVELVKILDQVEVGKKTSMTILDGDKRSGKSILMLQAMSTAFLKGWIVVNIPDGAYHQTIHAVFLLTVRQPKMLLQLAPPILPYQVLSRSYGRKIHTLQTCSAK